MSEEIKTVDASAPAPARLLDMMIEFEEPDSADLSDLSALGRLTAALDSL